MNTEHRDRNVQIFILIVHPGEPTKQWFLHSIHIHNTNGKTIREEPQKTDWVVLKLIVWSLSMLKVTGESPMQYFLNIVMQLCRHRLDGLFSWNKSPPSRIRSTYKKIHVNKYGRWTAEINNSYNKFRLTYFWFHTKSWQLACTWFFLAHSRISFSVL